ncbi:hypothetical protein MKW94_015498 [Papaver nudicaule]|uniref:Formin-like protein n=1 Tax=Papaver nudicaule TaxID=74823 RepID=A0AA41SIC1_PAPNU|nr:hypothetical protein [Papaver nudicaule]
MDTRRVSCVFLALLILYCTLVNGRDRKMEKFYMDPGSYLEIDDTMVEQLWTKCRLDLMQIKETVESFDLYFPEEMSITYKETNSVAWSAAKLNLQKAISVLPLQMKKTLFHCLEVHNVPLRVSEEVGISKNLYSKYAGFQFGRRVASRRSLGVMLLQDLSPTPSPSPSSATTPAPAPGQATTLLNVELLKDPVPTPYASPARAPMPVHTPAFSEFLDVKLLDEGISSTLSPAPAVAVTPEFLDVKLLDEGGISSTLSPAPAPAPAVAVTPSSSAPKPSPREAADSPTKSSAKGPAKPFFPPDFISDTQSAIAASPHIPSDAPPKKQSKQKEVSIAVGLAAAGTFVLAAILCFCFFKCRKRTDSRHPQKDDKPLLILNNNSSGDSAQKPGLKNSDNVDEVQGLPIQNPSGSSLASNNSAALPPPPGRDDAPPPPPPPGPPPPPPPRARPPPPPKGSMLPPRSKQQPSIKQKGSLAAAGSSVSGDGPDAEGDGDAPKTKLKPFFWDKLMANPDHSMVWHQIKSGSFQCDEEMIENLFGYAAPDKNKTDNKKEWTPQDPGSHFIKLIDPKKAQNLSILLRALNLTTEEVVDALQEGTELPSELLQTLLKMAPTADEELKLRLYNGELSTLGPAERFLKVLIGIPFAFKRMDSLLLMNSLQEELPSIKESLATLEVACKEVRNNRLFLKLLEAVLKTGNRMNVGTYRGGAQAFKLDTLLKLSDVKGADGKTTLLHFVVQEIIRSEGLRAARNARENLSVCSVKSEDLVEDSPHETEDDFRSLGLQVVSGLSSELENVRKASVVDGDGLKSTVAKLGQSLVKSKEFLNREMKDLEEDSGFHRTLKSFVERAEADITSLLEEEKRISDLVKNTGDYFHGNAGKEEALHLFVIVRDFLVILDKVCNEVRQSIKTPATTSKTKESSSAPPPSTELHQSASPDIRQRLFPAIVGRRMDDSDSSSDDESPSP